MSCSSTRCSRSAAIVARLDRPTVVVAHGAEISVYGRLPVTASLGRRALRRAAGRRRRQAATPRGRRPGWRVARCPTLVVPPGVDAERFRPHDADTRHATRRRLRARPGRAPRRRREPARPAQGIRRRARRRRRPRGCARRDHRHRPRRRPAGQARPGPRRPRAPARLGAPDRAAEPLRLPRTCSPCCAATAGPASRPRASASCSSRPRRAACPSVAGRSGGSPEAVLDGQTGVVVEPRDVDAARDAIGHLVRDGAPADSSASRRPRSTAARLLLRHARGPARAPRRRVFDALEVAT